MIHWKSQESHLLLNPKISDDEKKLYEKMYEEHKKPSHVFIATSGTMRKELKLVALSFDALLASADAVNEHLSVDQGDRWLLALPSFHVGGLGIWARAHVSGIDVDDFYGSKTWCPHAFFQSLVKSESTLTSMVPTQVYDLVQAKLTAPEHLRAVVIGGAALSQELYQKARQLDWPLLPSYGLSECASQVATAPIESLYEDREPQLKILNHVEVNTNESRQLMFKGKALFSGYVRFKEGKPLWQEVPRAGDYFVSQDLGEVSGNGQFLKCLGRVDDLLKINGEAVFVLSLQEQLQKIKQSLKIGNPVTLLALPDSRQGQRIQLVIEGECEKRSELCEAFNQKVRGFERSDEPVIVGQIPRSPLGKILLEKLRAEVLRLKGREFNS